VANSSASKSRDSLIILSALVLITACLYWARQILVPVALAVLLTFILTPAVTLLQRYRLGRLPSVLIVVLSALLLLSAAGYLISRQFDNLLTNLPKYEKEVIHKFQELRGVGRGGVFGKIFDFVHDISVGLDGNTATQQSQSAAKTLKEATENPDKEKEKSSKQEETPKQPGQTPDKPLYVQTTPSGWKHAAEAAGPALEGLGDAFLIFVLVIFMLIQRENLRNRLVRLVGHGRLIVTTQAFDEGAQRISRYLLLQLAVNTIFGATLTVGLFAIGAVSGQHVLWQYGLLWGFMAIIFRFIPYVGTWVTAALVTGFSVATLPGWYLPLSIFGFFVTLELLTANVVEPLLFGHSTGVSPLALLLAAAFWTWLWGPVGLILSTPLTVILVVLGKYVPELHFFEVLLGDEPVLSTDVTLYQRLVARDLDEAADLVEEYTREHPPEAVYEEVLLPALLHAKRDRDRGELEAENYEFVVQGIREVEDDLNSLLGEHFKQVPGADKVIALGCPACDEADELALTMLSQMLRLTGYSLEVVSSKKLTAEVLEQITRTAAAVVVVGALPPSRSSQARYLCKRIRQQAPDVKILVGRWGEKDNRERMEQRLLAAGADSVAWTLHDSRDQIVPLLQVAANVAPAEGIRNELVATP
jgi:predicted PurR-regulated permease PerM/CheY-like chemotaxis protein